MKIIHSVCVGLVLLSFASCITRHQKSGSARQSGSNNLITVNQTDVKQAAGHTEGDEILFRGSHNLFELIQQHASYFDQHHDVLIIEGSHNHIRLYNTNLLDIRGKGTDPLILVGNRVKYVVDVNNTIAQSPYYKRKRDSAPKMERVKMDQTVYDFSQLRTDFDTRPTPNEALSDSAKVSEALHYYEQRIQRGDLDTYYELAYKYHYGDGVAVSTSKAVDL